jgi:hypothetical protein
MSELARYALERLWEEGEFVLSHGVRQGDSTPVLVLAPALEQPAPETLRRLEYASFQSPYCSPEARGRGTVCAKVGEGMFRTSRKR